MVVRSFYKILVACKGSLRKAKADYCRERGWRGDEWYIAWHPASGDACRTLANCDRPCWPCEKGDHQWPLSDEVCEALAKFEEETGRPAS